MTRRDRPCEAERAMTVKAIAAYVSLGSHSERCSRSTRGWWAKAKMTAAAALLWRRRLTMSGGVAPPRALGSPRWPPWMGIAAAGRRTDGGRRPEATRGVIAIRLELGGGDLADKARRAFVLEGHSYAFSRQLAFTEAAADERRVCTNG